MPSIDLSILNQRQTPAFYADTLANRPAAGFVGRIFVSTNTFAFFRDNGTGWDLIGGPGTGTVTGSGAAGQVSFWNGASTITGNNDLFWDNVNGHLGIGTNVPGTALQIDHDQSQLIRLNQTTATNDTKIAFQNSGVALWRIGNSYNAGANDFNIFNINTNSNSVSFNRTNNAATFGGTVLNNILNTTITANASSDFSNSFTPTTTITDVNSYGLISRYKLDLTNGVYNATGTTNATAIFGFVNIDGNNGTTSTQPIRVITSGLAISTSPIKLAEFRHYQVNTPQALIIGSTITNVYGLYISSQKGATNLTITNGWGIYQNGANDNNYFNGSVLIGTTTVGSGKLIVASSTSDNHIQIVGANAPSLRIDNAETGPTKRAGLGISTATNNFIQGSADRDFCMFNGSTTASPILFGIYDAGTGNVQEAARISPARNFLIGTTTDAGQKLQVNGNSLITGTLSVTGASGGNSISVTQGISIGDGFGLNAGNFQVGAITGNRFYIYNNVLGIDNIVIDPSTGITKFNRRINIQGLPTSSAGLVAGDVWNNSGVLNIV